MNQPADIYKEDALTRELKSLMEELRKHAGLRQSKRWIQVYENFIQRDEQLTGIKKSYNEKVKDLNNFLETFPSNVMAKAMKVHIQPLYDLTQSKSLLY